MLIFISNSILLDENIATSACAALGVDGKFLSWGQLDDLNQLVTNPEDCTHIIILTSVGYERHATEENLSKIQLHFPGKSILFLTAAQIIVRQDLQIAT